MRIIGGKYSRRLIHPPKNLPVRPTTDLAKESLFNILRHQMDLEEKSALDLFAGTGSISYELASRGCSTVVSVDQNYRCIKFINETSRSFEMNIRSVRADVFKFIKSTPLKFDLIFADPPYDLPDIETISKLIFEHELLNPDGILIVEHPGSVDMSDQLRFSSHRHYSKVNFSFFR